MGRRVQKTALTAVGAGYDAGGTTNFVYDGWNLLAELNGANNNVICSYMWGLDLSGSLQGAGGVGGLLTVNPGGTNGCFAVYDGNGNVAGLTDSTGNISARYEYNPFGETIRASGIAAALNPIRFSTKYTDSESSFSYYGYRFYNASLGRWLNRDPIEEKGGLNLYAFVQNRPGGAVDSLGRYTINKQCCQAALQYLVNTRRLISFYQKQYDNFRNVGLNDIAAGLRELNAQDLGLAGIGAVNRSSRPTCINEAADDAERNPLRVSVRVVSWLGGLASDGTYLVFSAGFFEANSAMYYYLVGELWVYRTMEKNLLEILKDCEKKCKNPTLQGPGLF